MAESTSNPSNQSTTTPPFQYKKPATNCVCFITIPVTNHSRAQRFYASVFDWKFWTAPGSDATIFHTGGELMGRLFVREESEVTTSAAGVTLYVLVDDVDKSLRKVFEAGGSVEKEKFTEGGHTEMGLFRDTEGNLGGVLKWLM
ncbi:hypothetical protein EJ08DRAFT_646352 [Tothia fuscella]|uniref:Glyoxalase-like domain-containing protein n=1 Tax=Tothia fuscella TaxID=1048955 RepID=A0A9P4P153_9PEZI|nr:hypothetical protein EJ08DRAFT_646352 [Tothia fuscella]